MLADKWLAIGIFIASLPIATTLVIMAAFNVRLERMLMQNEVTLLQYFLLLANLYIIIIHSQILGGHCGFE